MKTKQLGQPHALQIMRINRVRTIGSPLIGHVWMRTKRLCTISEISDDFVLSGVTLLDMRYVSSIAKEFPERWLYEVALRQKLPRHASRLHTEYTFDSKETFLAEAASRKRMVALHPEASSADVCYVGYVERVDKRHVWLIAVTPLGDLVEEPQRLPLNVVTKIEIGTGYLSGLQRFVRYRHAGRGNKKQES